MNPNVRVRDDRLRGGPRLKIGEQIFVDKRDEIANRGSVRLCQEVRAVSQRQVHVVQVAFGETDVQRFQDHVSVDRTRSREFHVSSSRFGFEHERVTVSGSHVPVGEHAKHHIGVVRALNTGVAVGGSFELQFFHRRVADGVSEIRVAVHLVDVFQVHRCTVVRQDLVNRIEHERVVGQRTQNSPRYGIALLRGGEEPAAKLRTLSVHVRRRGQRVVAETAHEIHHKVVRTGVYVGVLEDLMVSVVVHGDEHGVVPRRRQQLLFGDIPKRVELQ